MSVLYELFRGADWPAPTAEPVREDRPTLPPPPPLWVLRAQYRSSGRWSSIFFYYSPEDADTAARRLGEEWRATSVVRYDASAVGPEVAS